MDKKHEMITIDLNQIGFGEGDVINFYNQSESEKKAKSENTAKFDKMLKKLDKMDQTAKANIHGKVKKITDRYIEVHINELSPAELVVEQAFRGDSFHKISDYNITSKFYIKDLAKTNVRVGADIDYETTISEARKMMRQAKLDLIYAFTGIKWGKE